MKGTGEAKGTESRSSKTPGGWRPVVRQLLPGMVLPGAIYAVASRFMSTLPALVMASSVPGLDLLQGLLRRKAPSPASIGFVAMAGLTSAMSLCADSPMFILAKGPAISAVAGMAFLISSTTGRPLCRTLAEKLTMGLPAETRERIVSEWHTERSTHVFKVLSAGWGLLLLACGVQQVIMALTLPAGLALGLESPVHLTVIGLGIAGSLLYVRKVHPVLASMARAAC
jgi:hypothetical protein